MGFFSWLCNHCNKSLLAKPVTMSGSVNRAWSEAVVLLEGRTLEGIYDGYGRILDKDKKAVQFLDRDAPEVYHRECYDLAGRPAYKEGGTSRPAFDQGYFINPDMYRGTPGASLPVVDRPQNLEL